MGQTNAPASSEWVDQFNRAVQYSQINVASVGGWAAPVVFASYNLPAIGNTTAETIQATYTFPGGCLGPNGYLEGTILCSSTASANSKTVRAYISNANDGLSGTRFVSYANSSTTSVVTMRQFYLYNEGVQDSQIGFPSASGGVGSNTSTFALEEPTINTAQTFYVTISGVKAVGTETLRFKAIRVAAVYVA